MDRMDRPDAARGEQDVRDDLLLRLEVLGQPDDVTCGPTCLHAVYRYHGDEVPLDRVIEEVPRLAHGGTLAVHLACHALRRGYRARLFTWDLVQFDPSWFADGVDLAAKLKAQARAKQRPPLSRTTDAWLEFLELGGEVVQEDLTPDLLRRHLRRGVPLLTGLSSTWLYRAPREHGPRDDADDVRGEASGHFVVLYGYEKGTRTLHVADPYRPNPFDPSGHYTVTLAHLVCSILLGILTDDANLLALTPARPRRPRP